MTLPGLKPHLHAHNPFMPQHVGAREWVEGTINGDEPTRLPFEVVFGIVRFATNASSGGARVDLPRARRVAEGWLNLPQAGPLAPTDRHFTLVMELMPAAMVTGPVRSDAILAAFAIENRARLQTNDAHF